MKRTSTLSVRTLRHLLLTAATSFACGAAEAQYCEPDGFTLGVEPICRLVFADIDNTSPGDPSAPAYEDFTTMTAHVEAGGTYTVIASGYTGSTPPNHLAANFDWDGDQTFETHVELADIVGDNCDTETMGSFTVPANAVVGISRVRFVKTFSYSADDDGCQWSSSYGQAEDYTIAVSPFTGIGEHDARAFRVTPNPGNGDITFVNTGDASTLDILVVDLSGRTLHSERTIAAPGSPVRLDLSGKLTPGTYVALVNSGSTHAAARFVVH